MNADQNGLDTVSSGIIGCAFNVSNALGCGFLEKVYENALTVEFRSTGIEYVQQPVYQVRHRNEIVGEYQPDLVIADRLVVEVKAVNSLNQVHQAQCINYLRVTGLKLALLLNFGLPRVQIKRVVMKL
jgi:GxxExxY protein